MIDEINKIIILFAFSFGMLLSIMVFLLLFDKTTTACLPVNEDCPHSQLSRGYSIPIADN